MGPSSVRFLGDRSIFGGQKNGYENDGTSNCVRTELQFYVAVSAHFLFESPKIKNAPGILEEGKGRQLNRLMGTFIFFCLKCYGIGCGDSRCEFP
jgi:hypothetical protein